jgi:hypothetical protein
MTRIGFSDAPASLAFLRSTARKALELNQAKSVFIRVNPWFVFSLFS